MGMQDIEIILEEGEGQSRSDVGVGHFALSPHGLHRYMPIDLFVLRRIRE
jgi:hypothetical protein